MPGSCPDFGPGGNGQIPRAKSPHAPGHRGKIFRTPAVDDRCTDAATRFAPIQGKTSSRANWPFSSVVN